MFVLGADGGKEKKLSNGFELNAGEPVWAADGKTVYFSSNTRESVEMVFFGKYLNNPLKTEPQEDLDRLNKDLP